MKKFIISFSFFILSSTVFATSVGNSIGGWQVATQVASGIGQKLTATKDIMLNGVSKTLTGTANITPKIGDVGRFIGKVGAAAIVTEALNQLLDGVDYVMDPANNTVTYKDKNSQADEKYTSPYIFKSGGYTAYSASSAVKSNFENTVRTNQGFSGSVYNSSSPHMDFCVYTADCRYANYAVNYTQNGTNRTYNFLVERYGNPTYDPLHETEKKTVPISDVATQVLDQAEKDIKAGNPASPAVVLSRAVAQDMATEAESDDVKARPIAQQFEQNQSVPTQEDSTGTIDTPEVVDPVTGEVVKPAESASVSLKWPKACEWFPTLCMFIDWMQKPHELDEPTLPKQELEKKEIDKDLITVNASQCPAPIPVNIPLPVFNTTYSDAIDITEYCPKIKDLAPVLQLLAFVLAVMIIREV